ncbi:MAG TPA: allantoicase [Streptosporangiaceae bacterium]|nr:allantoicase [Streptosporangiaceae bacterium]
MTSSEDAARVAGDGPDFAALPDLASRRLGGSVMFATDELFAAKENLIKPEPAVFAAGEFGPKGKAYDGWESRRRREPGHDYAIIRLGVPGVVHGVTADTSFFSGNYPPQVSVEAVSVDGYPSADDLIQLAWRPLVGRAAATGDARNWYAVGAPRHCTHVRLSIYPDGGVARSRVHGRPLPDPRFLTGTIDLAAIDNGGQLIDCSNAFYSSAWNLIMPGRPASMADGWENSRRRDGGFDYATFSLAAAGVVRQIEIDTTYFVGNAPGSARLLAMTAGSADPPAADQWAELLRRVTLLPDTRHRFVVPPAEPVTHVRLEVFPDGGLARLRVLGEMTPDASAALHTRYQAARQAVQ